MSTSTDDDLLTGPVPAPDAAASSAERAHARTFADIVDKALAGRPPVAMSADDRALLEVTTVIRAAHGALPLSASKRRSIVEDALHQGIGGAGPTASVTPNPAGRTRRWVPWAVAGASALVAAAAVLALWLRVPAPLSVAVEAAATPASWTSRPADPLVGPIDRARAGEASARIDYLFADRLDGYRERRLARGIARGSKP
jgi:hypothetical protein